MGERIYIIKILLGDQGSILGRVIPKTQNMVLVMSLLNTQNYKVRLRCKVEQSSERSSALGFVAIKKNLTTVANHIYIYIYDFKKNI